MASASAERCMDALDGMGTAATLGAMASLLMLIFLPAKDAPASLTAFFACVILIMSQIGLCMIPEVP